MDQTQAQFLPFNAINEFMRDDYRLNMIRETLNELDHLSPGSKEPIERLTKKTIQVPGFRNSTKAPVYLRIKPTLEAFERDPRLVAAVISGWTELHLELRQCVFDLLVERGWEVLPPEVDRSSLPGFLTKWPKNEDFEKIVFGFRERFPSLNSKDDDIALMAVWISGRLPYTIEE